MEEFEIVNGSITTVEAVGWFVEAALVKMAISQSGSDVKPPVVNRSAVRSAVKGAVDLVLDPAKSAEHGAWLACVLQLRGGDLVDREPVRGPDEFRVVGFSYRQAVAWKSGVFLAQRLDNANTYDSTIGPLVQVKDVLDRLLRGQLDTGVAVEVLRDLIPQFVVSEDNADAPEPARLTTAVVVVENDPTSSAGGMADGSHTRLDGVGEAIKSSYYSTPVLARMLILVLAMSVSFGFGVWFGAVLF